MLRRSTPQTYSSLHTGISDRRLPFPAEEAQTSQLMPGLRWKVARSPDSLQLDPLIRQSPPRRLVNLIEHALERVVFEYFRIFPKPSRRRPFGNARMSETRSLRQRLHRRRALVVQPTLVQALDRIAEVGKLSLSERPPVRLDALVRKLRRDDVQPLDGLRHAVEVAAHLFAVRRRRDLARACSQWRAIDTCFDGGMLRLAGSEVKVVVPKHPVVDIRGRKVRVTRSRVLRVLRRKI